MKFLRTGRNYYYAPLIVVDQMAGTPRMVTGLQKYLKYLETISTTLLFLW